MTGDRNALRWTPRALVGSLAALVLMAAIGGLLVYRSQRARLLGLEFAQLEAVAGSRAAAVASWRSERLGDVEAATETMLDVGGVESLEPPVDAAARAHIVRHLRALCRSYGYRRAMLFDAAGRVLVAADVHGIAEALPISGRLFTKLRAASAPALVDIDPAGALGSASRFVVLERLEAHPGNVQAFLALVVGAESRLLPPLDVWSRAGSSGSSFLVRRRGDRLVELLPATGGAPRQLVLDRGELAFVAGAVRRMREADGRPVYAFAQPVAGSSWYVVSRISREEIGALLRATAARIGGGLFLLVAAVGSGAWIFSQRSRARLEHAELERAQEIRRVLDHGADGVFIGDADGRIVEASAVASELLGREREEILGTSVGELLAPPGADPEEHFAELRTRGRGLARRTFVRHDGTSIETEVVTTAFPDGRVLGFVRDLSERRATEAQLRLLSQAVEESPAAVFIVAPDGRLEYVNRRYREVTGFAPVEVLGSVPRFLDPESSSFDGAAAILATTLGGKEWQGELVDRRKSGEIFFWHLRMQPILDDAGRIAHLLGVGEDVSERRRHSERFRLARRLFRLGVYEWDFQRRELWWSEETFEIHGLDPANNAPTWAGFLELVLPEDRGAVERAFALGVERGGVFEIDYRTRDAAGEVHRMRTVADVLRDASGAAAAALGVVLDVTEQWESERALGEARDQLQRAQRMEALGRLAGGVAHDFNNLLGIILGYADLVAQDAPEEGEDRARAIEIRRAAERAAELTGQLLAFGRRQALEVRPVSLPELIGEARQLLRGAIPESVELRVELEPGLEPVRADPSQLLQVLLNVALNARDAMPGGGLLELGVRRAEPTPEERTRQGLRGAGAFLRIEVRDNGSGMTAEVLEHAFEPFFTTRGASGASGLGLATVYGIVHQLGGNVELESHPGQGTAVRILLPCAGPAEAEERAGSRRGRTGIAGTRVLIVEDVTALGQMLEVMLAGRGCEVAVADTPARALELADRPGFEIDLLLTDLVMPGMDGREVARRLRQRLPGLKVVLMSGYSDLLADSGSAADLGADALLQKPFTRARLDQVLDAVLAAAPGAVRPGSVQ